MYFITVITSSKIRLRKQPKVAGKLPACPNSCASE